MIIPFGALMTPLFCFQLLAAHYYCTYPRFLSYNILVAPSAPSLYAKNRMSDLAATGERTPFEELPAEALLLTLSFVGNVSDFLALELTCTAFHQVVSTGDLDVWGKLIPGNCAEDLNEEDPEEKYKIQDHRFETFREQACVTQNVKYVRRQQGMTSNLLLDAFEGEGIPAVSRWKEIIQVILRQTLPDPFRPGRRPLRYVLRGDTMGTLMEILQLALVTAFQRALNQCLAATSPEDTYPVVQTHHLKLQDEMVRNIPDPDYSTHLFEYFPSEVVQFDDNLVPTAIRDKITRAAAFRAGVTKLDGDVFQMAMAWNALVRLISKVFKPVCLMLVGDIPNQPLPRSNKRKLVSLYNSIRAFPPLPRKTDNDVYLLTPVPRMIEEASADILSRKLTVYNEWLADGATEEEEIASAQAEYDWFDSRDEDYIDPFFTSEVVFQESRPRLGPGPPRAPVGGLVDGEPSHNATRSIVDGAIIGTSDSELDDGGSEEVDSADENEGD